MLLSAACGDLDHCFNEKFLIFHPLVQLVLGISDGLAIHSPDKSNNGESSADAFSNSDVLSLAGSGMR